MTTARHRRTISFSFMKAGWLVIPLIAVCAYGQAQKKVATFDPTDRAAVLSLARQSETVFIKSIEAKDMTLFFGAISKAWKEATSVAELNAAYQSLMNLSEKERYWPGRDFALEWPARVDEQGLLRITVRYPAGDEHVFVDQVYLQDQGQWRLSGYFLDSRPYNALWEKFTAEAVVLSRQGRFGDAADPAQKAFRIAAELKPLSPRLVELSVENLSRLYLAQMNFEPVISPRLFAVGIFEKAYGRSAPQVAQQLDQLQVAYVMLGRTNEAAICNAWASDVRAAAAGNAAAAKRLETESRLDRLWATVPGQAPAPKEDPKLAELRKKAEAGDAQAQHSLANAYRYGMYGLKEDIPMAAQWNRRAAEQGFAPSEYLVGSSYEYGRGVEKDMAKAVEWYRRSAEKNFAAAQFILAGCYERGRGVPRDLEKALEWYRRAEENGHKMAASKVKALSK